MDVERPLPMLSSEFAPEHSLRLSEPPMLVSDPWHKVWGLLEDKRDSASPTQSCGTTGWACSSGNQGILAHSTDCPEHATSQSQESSDIKEHDGLVGIAGELWQEMMKQPAFRKYREKMPRAWEKEDQKWPDQMEFAFVQALVEHPPIGRRKLNNVYRNDSKSLRGRNELIAIYIEKKTGVKRDRKQVSSHIQVLKPMFREQPWILSYFKSDRAAKARENRPRRRTNTSRARSAVELSNTATEGYDHRSLRLLSPASDRTDPIWDAQWVARSASDPGMMSEFQIEDFRMIVVDKAIPEVACHTFTRLVGVTEGLRRPAGDDIWSMRKRFPRLQELTSNDNLAAQVIACNSSINTSMQEIPFGAELRAKLEVSVPHRLRQIGKVRLVTTFYDACAATSYETTDQDFYFDGERTMCQLPFGSTFWALRTLTWQNKLSRPDLSSRAHVLEEIRNAVQQISAVQEVYDGTDRSGHPLLLICWNFEYAETRAGVTTCQNVVDMGPWTTNHFLASGAISSQYEEPADVLRSNARLSSHPHTGIDLRHLTVDDTGMIRARSSPTLATNSLCAVNAFTFGHSDRQLMLTPNMSVSPYLTPLSSVGAYPRDQSTPNWIFDDPGVYVERSFGQTFGNHPFDCAGGDSMHGMSSKPMQRILPADNVVGRIC